MAGPTTPIFCALARVVSNDESVLSLAARPVDSLVTENITLVPYGPDVAEVSLLADYAANGIVLEWLGVGVRIGVAVAPYAITEAVEPEAATFTSITPDEGPLSTPVVVIGTGLTDATSLGFWYFEDGSFLAGADFEVISDTEIHVTSPYFDEGMGPLDIRIGFEDPERDIVVPDAFTVVPAAGPEITSVSPVGGALTGSEMVLIVGSGFTDATEVLFGVDPPTNFVVDSDTQITVTTAAHDAGVVNVAVTTPVSEDILVDGFEFVVLPVVGAIDPVSGPVAGGTAVTITGTGFLNASSAAVGDFLASVVVVSDTEITGVTTNHGQVGNSYNVVVTTLGGSGILSNGFERTA